MTPKFTKIFFTMFVLCVFAILISAQSQTQSQTRTSSFTDPRDNRTYRAVLMPDGKTWMAQNLNFETESGSWCYDNDAANCEIYGRLYDWNTAMTACPQGWRLPSHDEWHGLIMSIDPRCESPMARCVNIGIKLRTSHGWKFESDALVGTDDYGFSALPAGHYRSMFGNFYGLGEDANWWTATAREPLHAWRWGSYYNNNYLTRMQEYKQQAHSVRCVRDD